MNYLYHNGYIETAKEVWAVDLSKVRISHIQHLRSTKVKIIKADAQSLEGVPDNYFDLVISTQVIEHVENDVEMLESLYRIARPGAIIYIDTVFKKRYGFYFYKNRMNKHVLDPTHEREYTKISDLTDKIVHANFAVIYSVMTPIKFSPLNFILRIKNFSISYVSQNLVLQALQRIKIRVIGYKCWKLILYKPLFRASRSGTSMELGPSM